MYKKEYLNKLHGKVYTKSVNDDTYAVHVVLNIKYKLRNAI